MADDKGIRILVADENSIFRRGLCEVLSTRDGFQVVGQAAHAAEARREAGQLAPDVAVIALDQRTWDLWVGLVLDLTRTCPAVRVLALGEVADEQFINDVLQAGASGYLPRSAKDHELWRAVEAVSRGETYLGRHPAPGGLPRPQTPAQPSPHLTGREKEIISLVADGLSNKEVASRLGISVRTVENHRASIMKKLGLRSVVDLIKYAISSGLVRVERA